jgi:hypothetical protein
MQPKTAKTRKPVNGLSRMVSNLRDSLGKEGIPISQTELAKLLKANRIQIVRWEAGTESPSTEKLVQMAMLAPSFEQKMKFWRSAIPEIDALRSDIYREDASRGETPRGTTAMAAARAIPMIEGFALSGAGVPFSKESESRTLFVSSECIASAGRPVALIIQSALRQYGRRAAPAPISVGDVVVIDRAQTDPNTFVETDALQPAKMAAVLLPKLPISLGKGGPQFMPDEAVKEEGLEPSFLEILENFRHPVVMLGFLSEEPETDVGFSPAQGMSINRWRLVFSNAGFKMPVTDWVEKALPRDIPWLHGASVFGAVVGWLKG